MLKRWSLKEQNRGASLMAVLVSMIFVGVIGMMIAQLTITNIQLKEAERASKVNFYSAEAVMDDLTSGLNNRAATALQTAYNEALANYRDTMVEGADLQKQFTRTYLDALETVFRNTDASLAYNVKFESDNLTRKYVIGYYKTDVIKESFSCYDPKYIDYTGLSGSEVEALKTQMAGYLYSYPVTPAYHIDYENGTFTLKDVDVRFTDSMGYETHISTDIVFHTPEINFTGSNVIKDFMRYSLIADTGILINAANVKVDGNAYAGHNGIIGELNGSALFKGNTVVTRGTITAKSGSNLTIGEGTTKLWAENIKTVGDGTASKLKLNGNLYISDDLTLEGKNSEVYLAGNYYGYNFQEKYTGKLGVDSAAYSSAIMINGKNSTLDLTNTNYLLLSGRTYISRGSYTGSSNQDVMLGESLSVRTNQLAYFVPDSFLTADGSDFDPTGGIASYAKYLGMDSYASDIEAWLNPAKPVVAYHYPDEGTEKICYYLNFKDEQSANDFFSAYAMENQNNVQGYAQDYVSENALIINDSVIYTLKGDILYREEALAGTEQDKTIYEKHVEIGSGDWEPNGIYFSYANRLGITYKCLQMYLEESRTDITAEDIRFPDNNDKTQTPLMNNLMDVDLFRNSVDDSDGTDDLINNKFSYMSGTRGIMLVDNVDSGTPYIVPTSHTEGIIIASGDVRVDGTFNGMIIAGGTITFSSNASVTADEMMVSQMFSKDVAGMYTADGSPLFAHYFRDYNTFSESVIGMIEIERFTSYEDWTKTEE